MKSEKLNWGQLVEIPEICINSFQFSENKNIKYDTRICAFFLTHIEQEIVDSVLSLEFLTRLIESASGKVNLFLHPMTFTYLMDWAAKSNDEDFRIVEKILWRLKYEEKIHFLETKTSFRLQFPSHDQSDEIPRFLLVTPISAGHNPGSVMLLFESDKLRILYTGNCRLLLKDLREAKALHEDTMEGRRPKKITSLYIDTMYCIETVQEFPAREEVIAKIFKKIKREIRGNPRSRFQFWAKGRLAIEDHLSLINSVYINFRDEIQAKPVPSRQKDEHCFLSFYAPINFNSSLYDDDVLEIEDQAYTVRLHCDMSEEAADDIQLNEENKVVYTGEDPYDYHGIYASHLSRFELGRFINYLRLESQHVHPLYRKNGMGGAEMEALIKSTCALVFGQEPKNLLQDQPSHFYDFTNNEPSSSPYSFPPTTKTQTQPKKETTIVFQK